MTDIEKVNKSISERLGKETLLKSIAQDDAPYLGFLDILCFDDAMGWSSEDFLEEMEIPGSSGLVLYLNANEPDKTIPGLPIAYILGHDYQVDQKGRIKVSGKGFYISSTGVAPGYRQRGIFGELYTLFESMQTSDYLFFHSRTKDNPRSFGEITWFERQGYQEHRLIRNYYEKNDHAAIMVKVKK